MKKILIIGSAFMLLMATSCKKYIDVNQTPNNPTSVPPKVLLPNVEIGMGFVAGNDLNRATAILSQHVAGVANQVAAYDIYLLAGNFDNQWNFEVYNGVINNAIILRDQTQATSPAYAGIAKLIMAYTFSVATDLWGDVPYSQAGQGLKYQYPRFDKQQDIYEGNFSLGIQSLFDLVKEGMADLDKTSVLLPSGTDDLVYKGNLTNWKKFGNSLLIKFAITIRKKDPTRAKTEITNALASSAGYINNTSLDFEVPFGGVTNSQNPIASFNGIPTNTQSIGAGNRPGDQMLSTSFLNLERSLNDTVRLSKFFTKPNGVFVSYANGSTAVAPTNANRSRYNVYLTGTAGEAPIRILTNFEMQFFLAEAVVTLGITGDANAYYQAGITANMTKIGMTATEISNYFATNPAVVTLSGTPDQQLQQIITQKYISEVGMAIEAYNDYRRTGYPVLSLSLNASGDNPNVIPKRLPYTNDEINRNPNTPNPRPKTDVPVWWAS